jgi:hypothetical protein
MKTLCQRAAHILSIMNSQAMVSYHALRLHRSIPLQYADPRTLRFRADTKHLAGSGGAFRYAHPRRLASAKSHLLKLVSKSSSKISWKVDEKFHLPWITHIIDHLTFKGFLSCKPITEFGPVLLNFSLRIRKKDGP